MKVLTSHSVGIAATAAALFLAAWAPTAWSQGISVSISTPNATIHPGDPIPIHFVMTNTTDHAIMVGRAYGEKSAELHYQLQVSEKTGRSVRESDYHHGIAGGWSGSRLQFDLKPGEKLEEDTEFTKQFDLSAPGTYEIQARRWVQGESKDPAVSNKLTVVVVAP